MRRQLAAEQVQCCSSSTSAASLTRPVGIRSVGVGELATAQRQSRRQRRQTSRSSLRRCDCRHALPMRVAAADEVVRLDRPLHFLCVLGRQVDGRGRVQRGDAALSVDALDQRVEVGEGLLGCLVPADTAEHGAQGSASRLAARPVERRVRVCGALEVRSHGPHDVHGLHVASSAARLLFGSANEFLHATVEVVVRHLGVALHRLVVAVEHVEAEAAGRTVCTAAPHRHSQSVPACSRLSGQRRGGNAAADSCRTGKPPRRPARLRRESLTPSR